MASNNLINEISTVSRFVKEQLQAYFTFRHIGPVITVYGSARFKEDNPHYQKAVELGTKLAKSGFAVMTGGGPGIMEAANKGAQLAGGISCGCSIKIAEERVQNKYLDKHVYFSNFFTRKVNLTKFSTGFIALAGGYGTLDELFEMATLIKTNKMKNFPIVLIGSDFWQPLVEYMASKLIENKTIYQSELECFYLTDSTDDAVAYIENFIAGDTDSAT